MTYVLYEADRLLRSGVSEDIKRYGDEDAFSERIREWLETPVGTLLDMPEWGHNIIKFEPGNVNLEVATEMAILDKMRSDIKEIIFLGIRVEFIEIDLCKIIIRHQFGDTVSDMKL